MPRPDPHRPLRPPPVPLDVDAVGVVTVGTVLWFVGFLVLLPFHGRLADAGHEVWLWTCLAGWILGLIGLPLCLRQRAATRRARAAAQPADAAADSSASSTVMHPGPPDPGPPDPDPPDPGAADPGAAAPVAPARQPAADG